MVNVRKTFLTLIFAITFVLGSISTLSALGHGMIMVNGRAVFSEPAPGNFKIEQETQQLELNYDDFSIQKDESLQVIHVVPESITSLRVTGSEKTSIAGKVESRGTVKIANKKGFVFYPGANFKVKKLTFDVR